MTRTVQIKSRALEPAVLLSAARLRLRALALLDGAREKSNLTQVELAARLGVRKAAVTHVLHGSGNVTLDTLGEYLGAMGFEVDLTVVEQGEILLSMRERRQPRPVTVTLRDYDRQNGDRVIALEQSANRVQPLKGFSSQSAIYCAPGADGNQAATLDSVLLATS